MVVGWYCRWNGGVGTVGGGRVGGGVVGVGWGVVLYVVGGIQL